jgi:hypothetical protein
VTTTRTWLAAALALAVGVALGALLRNGAGPRERPVASAARAAPEAATELYALRAELAAERLEREALEAEVAALRDSAEAAPAPAEPAPSGRAPALEDPTAAAIERDDRLSFDENALVERGISAREAADLRASYEELEMARLYLRDSAAREGWLRTPRFRRAVENQRVAFREDVGDRAFDLALFAAGRNNRIVVSGVLEGSPALGAGIESGDMIVRYDERPIFGHRDMVRATRQGRAGSSVPVDVLRKGELHRYYVARGPLGVRIVAVRRPPDTP